MIPKKTLEKSLNKIEETELCPKKTGKKTKVQNTKPFQFVLVFETLTGDLGPLPEAFAFSSQQNQIPFAQKQSTT